MVVTQNQFNKAMEEINQAFTALQERIAKLEAQKPVAKKVDKKK